MLSVLRRLGKELDNPESGWKQISSEDEKCFLITPQGTGSVIQDGDEVTIRLRYPGKDGKPEKFDELKTFLVTKDDTGFRGLRQGCSSHLGAETPAFRQGRKRLLLSNFC